LLNTKAARGGTLCDNRTKVSVSPMVSSKAQSYPLLLKGAESPGFSAHHPVRCGFCAAFSLSFAIFMPRKVLFGLPPYGDVPEIVPTAPAESLSFVLVFSRCHAATLWLCTILTLRCSTLCMPGFAATGTEGHPLRIARKTATLCKNLPAQCQPCLQRPPPFA